MLPQIEINLRKLAYATETPDNGEYWVVYKSKEESTYFRTNFKDEEDFDKRGSKKRIIKKGITKAESLELCLQVFEARQ